MWCQTDRPMNMKLWPLNFRKPIETFVYLLSFLRTIFHQNSSQILMLLVYSLCPIEIWVWSISNAQELILKYFILPMNKNTVIKINTWQICSAYASIHLIYREDILFSISCLDACKDVKTLIHTKNSTKACI